MKKEETGAQVTGADEGTAAGPEATGAWNEPATEAKQKPVRRFELKIGNLDVTKRTTAAEIANILLDTKGVEAVLILDGYRFKWAGSVE